MTLRLGLLWVMLCAVTGYAEPLKLWHSYRGAEEEALKQAVSRFTQTHGVPVELLALPFDAYPSKLTAAIPHGVGPDVFLFAHERLRSFKASGLISPVTAQFDQNLYLPGAIEALTLENKVYGYPLSQKTLALYFNKKLLSEAPKDTDALWAALEKHSDARAQRFGLAYESGDFFYHAAFFFGFNGKLFNDEGQATFTSDGLSRSLSFVTSLQSRGFIPQEASGALVKSLFNEGQAAMVVSGPWFAGEIAPEISYEVAPLPTVTETKTPLRPFLGVEAALVSAHSQQADKAHQLAQFLSGKEAGLLLSNIGRQIPTHRLVVEDEQFQKDPFLASFQRACQNAVPMPNTLEMSRVWEPMKLALRGVLQGGLQPEEAGKLAERRYRALYRGKPEASRPLPYVLLLIAAIGGWCVYVWRKRQPSKTRAPFGQSRRALAYVAPAALGISVLVVLPLLFGVGLAFFHHEGGEYTFVGFSNFTDILSSRGYRITEPLSFYFTLAVTVLWTVVNVALHVGIGLILALWLKSPLLRLRGLFRVLLIVPWAVPNYITALIWKGMFHRQFGAINGLLEMLGLEPISWFTRFSTSFAANVITNTWLGFPFMMVVCLGALQSIPQELYEAAEVDGASRWTQFRKVTLPLLRPALLPAIILGSVWTFNMFNIIYLVSGGEPGGATDILVSESYRWAFARNEQYGFAAAYSVLIFLILFAWSSASQRLTAEEPAS